MPRLRRRPLELGKVPAELVDPAHPVWESVPATLAWLALFEVALQPVLRSRLEAGPAARRVVAAAVLKHAGRVEWEDLQRAGAMVGRGEGFREALEWARCRE